MSPTSLLNVPSHLLREQAKHHTEASPMAGASDRSWAYVTCVGLTAVAFVLLVVLH